MRKIQNPGIAELLAQARFAPVRQRKKQLDGVEKLLAAVEKDKEYPFEFVCYKITGYRPTGEPGGQLIRGAELAEDLRIFIWKLSGRLAEAAWQQNQQVYTTSQLAGRMGVSTKTIDRWRKRGLPARKFLFEDGIRRIGFVQSAVDRFLADNPRLVQKAVAFSRLTEKERSQIIKNALAFSSRSDLSRSQIITTIASQTGRGRETIRALLADFQKTSPDKAGLLRRPSAAITSADAAEIYRLFKQGVPIGELTKRFSRSRSSIYRANKQRRTKIVLAKKTEFIASAEFSRADADTIIFAEPLPDELLTAAKQGLPVRPGGSLTDYLNSLKDMPVLSRDQEINLFRRYNYLKYLAAREKERIRQPLVPSAVLDKIENILADAEAVKNIIIESNLRLVVSIANRHAGGAANLLDLVSEGNVSLINAVEKFDYTRGFRFATYASWAIIKDFARKMPAERLHLDRSGAALGEVESDLRTKTVPDIAAIERARHNLLQVIKENLDQREQYIIINHFGLTGTLLRKNKKALQQIGDDLNLSKERIRQLELAALQKLRQTLSPEEFELLTG